MGRTVRNKQNQLLRTLAGEESWNSAWKSGQNLFNRLPASTNFLSVTPFYTLLGIYGRYLDTVKFSKSE